MFAFLLISIALLSSFAQSQDWSYSGSTGPSNWPKLFPQFCSYNRQSPINITRNNSITNVNITDVKLNGYSQSLKNSKIENTGRTVEITPSASESYSIEGGCARDKYILDSIHFHWSCNDSVGGSEHAIKGVRYALEGHFVHRNQRYSTMEEAVRHSDGLAVIAVFYETSWAPAHKAMAAVTDALENIQYANSSAAFSLGSERLDSLLPPYILDQQYFCYNGSLTTPNCNEAVIWTVYQNPQMITKQQTDAFCQILSSPRGSPPVRLMNNDRPLQPVNNRTIFRRYDRL